MSHRLSPRRNRARLGLESLEERGLLSSGGFSEFALPRPATAQFVQVHDILAVADDRIELATTKYGAADPTTGMPTYQGTSIFQSTADGAITAVHAEGDATRSALYNLVNGPDGNVWGIVDYAPARLNGDGSITRFPLADGNYAQSIATGPDGALWFTEPYHGLTAGSTADSVRQAIGRITPSGTITEYLLPQNAAKPDQIASGPGGMWFTLNDFGAGSAAPAVGRISVLGGINEYAVPNTSVLPHAITAGPDGNVWFTAQGIAKGSTPATDTGSNFIGRVTPGGSVTLFPLGAQPEKQKAGFVLGGITAGPDGNVWFAEPKSGRIGTMNPAGTAIELPVPTGDSAPTDITLGRDGALWFTELLGNKVGRYLPGPDLTVTATPAPATAGAATSAALATFRDNTPGVAASYVAAIDWGDGSAPSPGTIARNADGFTFSVSGAHAYARSGNYTVAVAVREPSGETAASVGSMSVKPAGAVSATFVPVGRALGVRLAYGAAIDGVSAKDVSRYTLAILGKPNRKGVRPTRAVRIKSASYDAATGTVLLTPRGAINRKLTVQVTVRGEGTLTVV